MANNLDFAKLINLIENITPYYYVKSFKDKIQKLIKKADNITSEHQKLVFMVNNMNDIHFSLHKKRVVYPHFSTGLIIIYNKQNGSPFTSERDGKFIVIRSNVKGIEEGDEIISFDNKKVLDVINDLIYSYEIPGYSPIITLGDLQKRSLDLLRFYSPIKTVVKRNNSEMTIKLDNKHKIYFNPTKKQSYKEMKINNKDTFYFSIKGFNFNSEKMKDEKDKYFKILEYLKENLNNYEYIILDLRKTIGGNAMYVFMLLKIIYGESIMEYLNNIERLRHVHKISDTLIKYFTDDMEKVQEIKKAIKDGKEYYIQYIKGKEQHVDIPNIKKNIKFKKTLIVLMDFNCSSTCSILLDHLKNIRNKFNTNTIFLGTEDQYDTKFTHPYTIEYDNYYVWLPTKYRQYRVRDDYETIKPDYYYLDTTYEFQIPIDIIENILHSKNIKKRVYHCEYTKYKQKYLKLKGGEQNIIIHISGPQGAGKTTLGNKLKDKYGDKIYVKDLDHLYGEFSRTDQKDYQVYINQFMLKHKDKPIIITGLDADICLGPRETKDMYYNVAPEHKFYIDLPKEQIQKQRFFRQVDKLNQRKEWFFDTWLKDPQMIEDKLKRFIDLKGWNKQMDRCAKLYKQRGYKFLPPGEIEHIVNNVLSKQS